MTFMPLAVAALMAALTALPLQAATRPDLDAGERSILHKAAFPELLDAWSQRRLSTSTTEPHDWADISTRLAIVCGLVVLFAGAVPGNRHRPRVIQRDWAARAISRRR